VSHVAQLRSQNGDHFPPEFGNTLQLFRIIIGLKKAIHFFLSLLQICVGVLELAASARLISERGQMLLSRYSPTAVLPGASAALSSAQRVAGPTPVTWW
jgi:hypothetical protein